MAEIQQYLEAQRDRNEELLCELLRIPSVSADSRHRSDVQAAAQWVYQRLQGLGLEAELVSTNGHPLVYAESPPVPGAPTVLVYGHYDVQPPDPLDEWITPPFEPTRRDGNIYARGATDDKGQMLTHILSTQAWLETGQTLPVQLKFLIEGEEEVGSQGLYDYLESHAEQLACDVVVISDTSQFAKDQPAICYGLRGIAYYELHVKGPRQDQHSGVFGGAITNPVEALAQMLARIKDDQGRIQIPGFYDKVRPPSAEERAAFAALPFDQERFRTQVGVSELFGEAGYSTLERRWVRPSYDINGIWGGYQGEGAKTVLPARASAKFSFRLVPDQSPTDVASLLNAYLEEIRPVGVQIELVDLHGGDPFLMPSSSPYIAAARAAIEAGFGVTPVLIREGGSIPIVTAFAAKLGAAVLLLGWGLDDDNLHGPNEKFSLTDFHRGTASSARLWAELASVRP